MRHDTCTDEARCQDYPLCRHRGFPLDEGDTGSTFWPGAPVAQDGPIDAPPGRYREAIGSFVGTVIALSATERERDELRAEVERLTEERDGRRRAVARWSARAEAAEATVGRVEAVCGSLVGHLTISQSESGTQPLAGEWVRLDDLRAALHPEEGS